MLQSFVFSIGAGDVSAQAFYQQEINNLRTFVPTTAHLHEELVLFLARQQQEVAEKLEGPTHLLRADSLLSYKPRPQRLAHLFDLVANRVFFSPRSESPADSDNSAFLF